MQNLQMESGPKYFKYGILAVIAIVFVAGAYTLTRTNNPPGEVATAQPAISSDQAMNAPAATPADAQQTVASNDVTEQVPSLPDATLAAPAMTETSPAATAAAAKGAKAAMPAPDAQTRPEPVKAASAEPVAAVAVSEEPAVTAPVADEATETKVASSEPENSAPKQPITGPRPSALDALDSWWSPSAASPFKVEYVGQLVDKNSLVILFSGPVQDTAAASQHIRVVAEDGSTVDTNWQTGGTSRMMVQNDLEPGRYIVMIDPAVSNAQGQALGSSLRGPVYIQ